MGQRIILFFALPVVVFLAFITFSIVIGGNQGRLLQSALLGVLPQILLFASYWALLPLAITWFMQVLAAKRTFARKEPALWGKILFSLLSMSYILISMNWAYRFSSDIRRALLLLTMCWLVIMLGIFSAYKHRRRPGLQRFGYKVHRLLMYSILSSLWFYLVIMPVMGIFYF